MPDWKMTGYILTSKHRTNVIRCLKEAKSVMQEATELNVKRSVVYKAVNELLSAGTVIDLDKDKKRNTGSENSNEFSSDEKAWWYLVA